MRYLTVCLILALTSLCQGQTFNPAKRQATGKVDHAAYTIGDVDGKGVFEARVKMEFWGEDSIEFRMENISGVATTVAKRVILPWTGNSSMEWLQEKNALKWKFKFAAKPVTNTYQMKLGGNWQDFHFRYQPPFPSPTTFIDQDGDEALRQVAMYGMSQSIEHRKRKVDGSYAVYHKWKKHHARGRTNYRAGKAMHIAVPRATDAAGKSVWCAINIDQDVYTVVIPQIFLDTASYPVIVNDEFGYHTIGGTGPVSLQDDWHFGGEFTTNKTGTGNFLSVYGYVLNADDQIVMGLYDDAKDATLVVNGGTAEITPAILIANVTWNNAAFGVAPALADATPYRMAVHIEDIMYWYYDAAAGEGAWDNAGEAYTGTAIGAFTWDNVVYGRDISLYIDYTPSGVSAGQVIMVSE